MLLSLVKSIWKKSKSVVSSNSVKLFSRSVSSKMTRFTWSTDKRTASLERLRTRLERVAATSYIQFQALIWTQIPTSSCVMTRIYTSSRSQSQAAWLISLSSVSSYLLQNTIANRTTRRSSFYANQSNSRASSYQIAHSLSPASSQSSWSLTRPTSLPSWSSLTSIKASSIR